MGVPEDRKAGRRPVALEQGRREPRGLAPGLSTVAIRLGGQIVSFRKRTAYLMKSLSAWCLWGMVTATFR